MQNTAAWEPLFGTHHRPWGHTLFAALLQHWQPRTCTSLYQWPGRCWETALALQTAPESETQTTTADSHKWTQISFAGTLRHKARTSTSRMTSVPRKNLRVPAGRAGDWPRGYRLLATWSSGKEPLWPHTPIWQVRSPKPSPCHLGWRWLEELQENNMTWTDVARFKLWIWMNNWLLSLTEHLKMVGNLCYSSHVDGYTSVNASIRQLSPFNLQPLSTLEEGRPCCTAQRSAVFVPSDSCTKHNSFKLKILQLFQVYRLWKNNQKLLIFFIYYVGKIVMFNPD